MSKAMHKPTLLVADDEEEIGEIFRALAEDLGFDVTCVTEGSEVVELVDRMRPTVIALDLRMPGTDGVEVIRELGRRGCKAAIILMSGMDQRTLSSVQALASDPSANYEDILEHIHMLKVDLSVWSRDQLAVFIPELLGRDVKLAATNVNTQDEQAYCQELGFEFFQGQFVSEPVMVSGNTLKPSRMALLNILKLLEDPDCDISDLEELISQDITLSYKILRIINSAFYGFRRKIDSVKQAVVSLGLKVIRDWFIVISLTDIDDKPESLMFQTLQRARMMQLLSDVMGLNKDTGFTIGLFSSIDAIMDQPMEVILKSLPLSDEITDALLDREGLLGELLDIVIRYEQGDWKNINSVGFEASELSTYYFESMIWTRGLFEQIKAE